MRSHVDHDRARRHVFGTDQTGNPCGHDEDFGPTGVCRQISRPRVALRHRGVGAQQQHGQRLADDRAPPDDDRLFARHVYTRRFQAGEGRGRRAGDQGGAAHRQQPQGFRPHPLDVLPGRDGLLQRETVQRLRHRQVNHDPADGRVFVQFRDGPQCYGHGRIFRQLNQAIIDPHRLGVFRLRPGITQRRRIGSEEYRGQRGGVSTLAQRCRALCRLFADLDREVFSVDQFSGQ